MARASARHILVSSEEQCNALKQEIENGRDFADVAKQHPAALLAVRAATWAALAPAKWCRNSTKSSSAVNSTRFTGRFKLSLAITCSKSPAALNTF